jgi:hypothetical protein
MSSCLDLSAVASYAKLAACLQENFHKFSEKIQDYCFYSQPVIIIPSLDDLVLSFEKVSNQMFKKRKKKWGKF